MKKIILLLLLIGCQPVEEIEIPLETIWNCYAIDLNGQVVGDTIPLYLHQAQNWCQVIQNYNLQCYCYE